MPISALAYASQVLTASGNAVADETVTIGSQVYKFVASPAAENDVDLGTDAETSLQNLFDAINGTGTAGTQYHADTDPNAHVVASAVTASTLTVTSKVPGAIGNFIPSTETSASTLSWGSTVLAGGTGSVATAISEILDSEQVNASVYQILLEMFDDGSDD